MTNRCLEYTNEVSRALVCEHHMTAIDAYLGLRRAITLPDDMSEGALRALRSRVEKASNKYPDAEGRSNAAFNKVLRAYGEYLSTVMWERDHVG